MSDMIRVKVTGAAGVSSTLRSVLIAAHSPQVKRILLAGAKKLAMASRSVAAKSKHGDRWRRDFVPPGALRASIVWRIGRTKNPAAFAYVVLKPGGVGMTSKLHKFAPYGLIIDKGVGDRIIKKSKNPKLIGKRLGPIRGSGYFTRTVSVLSTAVVHSAFNEIDYLITRSMQSSRVLSAINTFGGI